MATETDIKNAVLKEKSRMNFKNELLQIIASENYPEDLSIKIINFILEQYEKCGASYLEKDLKDVHEKLMQNLEKNYLG